MSVLASLDQKLAPLKLGRLRAVVVSWIRQAEQQQLGYAEFLDELLAEEVLGRQENQIRRTLKAAGFAYAATVEQFDFSLRAELKRSVMMRFFDSAFVEKAGSLILIGPSGLGKTHLAIALGTRMVQLGYSVRFLTAQQFAKAVLAAPSRAALEHLLTPLSRCDLLILDEFGYLSVESQVGRALYELVSGRYTHRATVITSNKSLATWGELVGGDRALMMAILERLLHHGEVFYLRGSSYRMRGKEPLVLAGMLGNISYRRGRKWAGRSQSCRRGGYTTRGKQARIFNSTRRPGLPGWRRRQRPTFPIRSSTRSRARS